LIVNKFDSKFKQLIYVLYLYLFRWLLLLIHGIHIVGIEPLIKVLLYLFSRWSWVV